MGVGKKQRVRDKHERELRGTTKEEKLTNDLGTPLGIPKNG